MYEQLKDINKRPGLFEFYTAERLWNDEHISGRMLEYHLDSANGLASRKENFINSSVKWIQARFRIGAGVRIADFGCGPGLYTTRLARLGAEVTGIDFSRRSIRYARESAVRENLKIKYLNQNYLEFETDEKFDLICLIFDDLCPLSPGQRKTMLTKFRSLLADNGCILLDVVSLKSYAERQECAVYERRLHDGFWAQGDYYGFMNTFKYENEKVVLDKYTIVEADKTWQVYNWLQYFSLESISREFENNGLRVAEYYSDVAGEPYSENAPEIALVAVKN
ncbi:MAG: class I SAM-dependent methyltransferase [Victivallaceae bacterium]|nr:class I SAM-dependent methyltransferase [Victivallaceae bacterium]